MNIKFEEIRIDVSLGLFMSLLGYNFFR